jgi:peptidoglycan LD-endopeptidase CwlK
MKIAQIQEILGVAADGIWGPQSQKALDEERRTPNAERRTPNGEPAAGGPAVDERSASNIATLLPPVRPLAVQLLQDLRAAGIGAKIISGTRTYEEQDVLYAQGRTRGGTRVTNARAGHSNHNFGVAFDIGIFDANGKYWEESPAYAKAGEIGKKLGLLWGGDWRMGDEPHFEYRPAWAAALSETDTLVAYRARRAKDEPIV